MADAVVVLNDDNEKRKTVQYERFAFACFNTVVPEQFVGRLFQTMERRKPGASIRRVSCSRIEINVYDLKSLAL